jgi:small-conductance mechanosensitive channel
VTPALDLLPSEVHSTATGPLGLAGVVGATTPAAANDRGVIHQFLIQLGVSSNTAHAVQVWTIGPIKVVVILAIAWIITRLERRFSRRLVLGLRLVSPLSRGTVRGTERAETIAGVVSAVLRTVIWVIAWLTVLSQLGIRLGPFVAGATVVGAAVGFGAQTLVKDFLSGLLILAEDQYGVGDSIMVGNTVGTVEGVTLRVTRIRAVDGVVWYVPNGDIRTVANNSDGDSVAMVEVTVPLGTDLGAAAQVADDELRVMAADPRWADRLLGRPTFSGVANVTVDGVTIRVVVPTAAGANQQVARELQLRIVERLRLRGLAWGPPPSADGRGVAGGEGVGPGDAGVGARP